MNNTVTSIVIGALVLILVVYRQLRKSTVREDGRPWFFVVLFLVGGYELVDFVSTHSVNVEAVALLVVSLLLAAGFGVARAYTVRLTRENGVLYRQGTLITLLLWLIGVAAHFGTDSFVDAGAKGLASAALVLYLAVTFGVQRVALLARARAAEPAR